jgi:hypothetical protein
MSASGTSISGLEVSRHDALARWDPANAPPDRQGNETDRCWQTGRAIFPADDARGHMGLFL